MEPYKNKNRANRPTYLIMLILSNAILGMYYGINSFDVLTGNYNPDGWRFGIYILCADIVFIIIVVDIIRSKDWRFLPIAILNILGQNLILGIIKFMPFGALVVSIFFFVFLLVMISRKN